MDFIKSIKSGTKFTDALFAVNYNMSYPISFML